MSARRAIFITGGASGLGRAIAQRFAREGWFVGLGDLDEKGMAETEELIGSGFTYSARMDVSDAQSWDKALKTFTIASGGRIDALANNAGVPLAGNLAELSIEEIDRTLDVNLRGALYGARAAYPFLKETAPGSCLINTASAACFYGTPSQSVYGATKAGIRSLTETLDGEWADDGIRVHSIIPSFIDTPLLQKAPNASSTTAIRDVVAATGIPFTPVEDVAEATWQAMTSDKVHLVVGSTAKKMRFAARWMPKKLRDRARKLAAAHEAKEG